MRTAFISSSFHDDGTTTIPAGMAGLCAIKKPAHPGTSRAAGSKLSFSYPPPRNGLRSCVWPQIMPEACSMMGEACYAPIDITRRKCVKSVVFQLRIELNDASVRSHADWVDGEFSSILGAPAGDYLITLSALANTLGGIVRPICFAAFRLMMNSNFFGCSTGRSAGLAPFKILST